MKVPLIKLLVGSETEISQNSQDKVYEGPANCNQMTGAQLTTGWREREEVYPPLITKQLPL